jgi:hypothetical protein
MGDAPFQLVGMDRPDKLSSEVLTKLEGIYKRGARTIRRWWKAGAPILAPEKMPAWWTATHSWEVPAFIRDAARGVASESSVASASTDPAEEGMLLAGLAYEDGEALEKHRRLVKGLWEKLEKAYETGTNIDLIQTRYNKAISQLRSLEANEREAQKIRGTLLPRVKVERDIASALELLKAIEETEIRRVIELCPALNGEARHQVESALAQVAEAKARLFRNLKSLKSPADVADMLAA